MGWRRYRGPRLRQVGNFIKIASIAGFCHFGQNRPQEKRPLISPPAPVISQHRITPPANDDADDVRGCRGDQAGASGTSAALPLFAVGSARGSVGVGLMALANFSRTISIALRIDP